MYGCITNKSIREAGEFGLQLYLYYIHILPQFVFVLVNSQFPLVLLLSQRKNSARRRVVQYYVQSNITFRYIPIFGNKINKMSK